MLSFTACANPTFTWSPLATVTISSVVPTTLNFSPPDFDNFCPVVDDALSPPNLISLSPILSNWLLFTASVGFTPGATFLITLFPALIPSLFITTSFVPGVAPGIVIVLVVTESSPVKSLFKLYVYLWSPDVTSCFTVKLSPAT